MIAPAIDSGRARLVNLRMVETPRYLHVVCKRCGHAAGRKRKPGDLRTPPELAMRVLCGKCRARAVDGDVRISLDGGKSFLPKHRPERPEPPPYPDPSHLADRTERHGKAAPLMDIARVALLAVAVLGLGQLAFVVLSFGGRLLANGFDRIFSEAAFQSSYNLADGADRKAFCLDHKHIGDGRNVRLVGETTALRQQYYDLCQR